MAIGTTAAILMAAGMGASTVGNLIASSKAASAATKAAETQAGAAETASADQLAAAKVQADAILKAAQESGSLQELTYLLGREDTAPWRDVGGGALMTLSDLLQPEGYLAEGYPEFRGQFDFKPQDVTMDPGFDFRLKEGQKALERSAAARGGVLSGASAKALERYAQDYSSGEYGVAYGRKYGEAADRYNQALERYRTNYSVDQANRSNLFGRLSTLAGFGGTSAGQTAALGGDFATSAGRTGEAAAANAANIATAGSRAASDYATSAAAARASGYVGGANAWQQGVSNSFGQIPSYLTMAYLLKGKG